MPSMLAISASIVTGLAVGGLIAETSGAEFPIDKLLGAGAAGSIIFVMILFLKRDEKMQVLYAERDQKTQALHSETIKQVANEFSETALTLTKTYAESQKEADARAERREEKLRELFHTMTRDKA